MIENEKTAKDCRDCKNYSRWFGVNCCDILLPPCFGSKTHMVHDDQFMNGFTVFTSSACSHFQPGKHSTRAKWEDSNAAEAKAEDGKIVAIFSSAGAYRSLPAPVVFKLVKPKQLPVWFWVAIGYCIACVVEIARLSQ